MNRRNLLASCAALAVLAGCSASGTIDPSQAISDAGIVVNGVASIYASLTSLYPGAVSPAQQAAVAGYFAAARSALTQLSATASALTNSTNLQAVEIAIANVLSALGSVVQSVPGVPPAIVAGITAAQVLLPLIEAVADQLRGVPVRVAVVKASMPPDQARLILREAGR